MQHTILSPEQCSQFNMFDTHSLHASFTLSLMQHRKGSNSLFYKHSKRNIFTVNLVHSPNISLNYIVLTILTRLQEISHNHRAKGPFSPDLPNRVTISFFFLISKNFLISIFNRKCFSNFYFCKKNNFI